MPQNRVRRRSILCPEPVFWGPSALPPAIGGSWTPRADPQPQHQAGPSLSHSAPIAFSLQFGVKKKKRSPAWKHPPCLALVSPVPLRGLAPAWGQGAGGRVAGPTPGSPAPTKAHKELSFKKAGGGEPNADPAKGREF